MSQRNVSPIEQLRAEYLNRTGLAQYERWELENAVSLFQEAIRLDATEPEYYLNLARAQVRLGNYNLVQQALRDYLPHEKDQALINRFESLLDNALDEVETRLTTLMPESGQPLNLIKAAMKMWWEYRVARGRQSLDLSQPGIWAAALEYTIRKINLDEFSIEEIAERHNTTETAIRICHTNLIQTLDLISCDYRYFRGQNNPLDQLAEAAALLEEAERRFRQAKQIMQKAIAPQKQRRRLATVELPTLQPGRC